MGKRDFWSGDYRIMYSGDNSRITGVGYILNKEIGERVTDIV